MRAERLTKATAAAEKVGERFKYANNRLDRARPLYKKEIISLKELEDAEEQMVVRAKEIVEAQAELKAVVADDLAGFQRDVALAEKEVAQAESKLRLLLAGSRPEEVEAVEADITRLEAQQRHLSERLRLLNVVTPVSGVVTTPKPRDRTGQYVTKGDLIVEVHEFKAVRAEIAVPESDIGDVAVGQPVVLRARAFPGRTFEGRVTDIAAAAVKEQEGWRGKVLRVTTAIDNPDLLLKPEMTGNAKIYCGKRRLVDLLTRRLARYLRVEFWSWW
jgi:multidrug resistance efflux pump